MSTTATAESHTASTSDPTRAEAKARLTEVHATFGRELLGYLGQFTAASRQGADDLLQETMIRVWRRIEGLPIERENARRWLFTVARNVGIDAIRRAKARPVVVDLRDEDRKSVV
jgi:RNA polymerase sigma-70 factor, ECF subfamily